MAPAVQNRTPNHILPVSRRLSGLIALLICANFPDGNLRIRGIPDWMTVRTQSPPVNQLSVIPEPPGAAAPFAPFHDEKGWRHKAPSACSTNRSSAR